MLHVGSPMSEAVASLFELHPQGCFRLPLPGCSNGVLLELPKGEMRLYVVGGYAAVNMTSGRWLASCVGEDETSKRALTRAFMRFKRVEVQEARVDGCEVELLKSPMTVIWDDLFPTEELPSFELIDRQVELVGSRLYVREKVYWETVTQVYERIFNTCMLSDGLIGSISKTKMPALGVKHGLKVWEGDKCIHEIPADEYDQGEIRGEDPYLGKTKRFGCVKCGITTFGLDGDRVCHECEGGKLSHIGGKKIEVIEELESIVATKLTKENWRALDGRVRQLMVDWKSAGDAVEGEQSLWERFDKNLSVFYKKKDEFFEDKRAESERNLAFKKSIIEKAEILEGLDIDPRDAWFSMKALMHEWKKEPRHCGLEVDQKLWLEIKGIQDRVFAKMEAAEIKCRAEWEENRIKKENLVKRAAELSQMDITTETSSAMVALLDEWKSVGQIGKTRDDELWAKFVEHRKVFYDRKRALIESKGAELEQKIAAKENLISMAVRTSVVTDWKEGSKTMRELMESWRELGGCREREPELWLRFNTARQVFYEAMKESQAKAVEKKEAIVKKMKGLGSLKSQDEIFAAFTELMNEWKTIGSAGREEDGLWDAFCKARFEILGY